MLPAEYTTGRNATVYYKNTPEGKSNNYVALTTASIHGVGSNITTSFVQMRGAHPATNISALQFWHNMRKSVDTRWDTVDPDKQTASQHLENVSHARNHCTYLACPTHANYYSQGVGEGVHIQGYWKGMTFYSEGLSVYLSGPTELLSYSTSLVPSKNERESKSN